MPHEFLKSNRGGDLLSDGKFIFRKRSTSKGGTTYWKCTIDKCGATASTVGETVVKMSVSADHSHDSKVGDIQARKFKRKLIDLVGQDPLEPAQKIYR